jgi:hypothetical protein
MLATIIPTAEEATMAFRYLMLSAYLMAIATGALVGALQ